MLIQPSAAERLAAAEASVPGALELAALLPQAARIERRLLRALRVEVMKHLRASDEAELWTSDLVEMRAIDGLVLRADVQALLRQRGRAALQRRPQRGAVAEQARRLREANALMVAHHANAPPLVQLEEEIAWLAMEMAEPEGTIQDRLEVVLAALVRDGRTGVARWAARALPRLPEAARGTKAAWQLSVASADRMPAARSAMLPPPAGLRVVDLKALAPHLGQVPLGVRRIGDVLELGAVGPGGFALMVPASEPRFVSLRASGLEGDSDRAVPTGTLQRVSVGWSSLAIEAADGRQWSLPVLSDEERQNLEALTLIPDPAIAGRALGTFVSSRRAVLVMPPPGPSARAALRFVDATAPYPYADSFVSDLPQGARVVSWAIDAKGDRVPVVGIWSHDGKAGPTVIASVGTQPAVLLGAPVLFAGALAGVVRGADIQRRTRGGAAGFELHLDIESRPDVLRGEGESDVQAAIKVELLPAGNGEAVLLSWGPPGEQGHLLVDGGPRRTAKTVRSRVQHALGDRPWLDMIVISHADANRLEGIGELLGSGIAVRDVWFNGPAVLARRFGTAGAHSLAVENLEQRIQHTVDRGPNAAFDGQPIFVAPEGPLPRIELAGGATITVLGPDERALAMAAKAWSREAAKRSAPRSSSSSSLAPDEINPKLEPGPRPLKFGGDSAANNGASLVLLFEYQGHSVLLPGDAHAEPLVAALRRLAAERQRPGLFVDVAVLPHGGSRANVVPELFEVLEAGTWAVCTDGSTFGHPDPETIELLARRAQGSTLAFNYRGKTTERWAAAEFQREHKLRVLLPERPVGGLELAVGSISGTGAATGADVKQSAS